MTIAAAGSARRAAAARAARTRLAPAALACVFAALLSAVVVLIAGHSPGQALSAMVGQLGRGTTTVDMINTTAIYYLSGVAISIGFAMNLFNIGVEGQYRVAAVVAAAVGGWMRLPTGLDAAVIVLAAAFAGAVWALIPALLKVFRGVHEVISSIMLNAIATGLVSYLLGANVFGTLHGNNISTPDIPAAGQVPGWSFGSGGTLFGLVVLAAAVGVGYWLLLEYSRFGFELRASGESPTAARAGGVNPTRMIVVAMLLSGAVAGLVGMPELLGHDHNYSITATTGYGFTGIAVALIGRGHPVGVAIGALLWSFLDKSAVALDGVGIPREIVMIMQGTIVLAIVIAYRVAGRREIARQQRLVGRAKTAAAAP
jgi:simple sugar transport system permease protein